jgi:tetratricopeptide (TPR) repeat protein
MEELKIKIKLEFSDFLNFQYWILGKRYLKKYILIVIFMMLLVILPTFNLLNSFEFSDLTMFIFPFTFIVAMPLLSVAASYYGAKRYFNNDPSIRKEQEYIFNSLGIQVSSISSQTKLTWEELHKFEESPKNLIIQISTTKFFIFPKNQLTEKEIISLREMFPSNIKTKAAFSSSIFPKPVYYGIMIIPVSITLFINFYPKKSEAYYKKGYAKEQQADYEGAIIEYDKAIENDPSLAKAYNRRGYSKGMMDNYTGEIEDCSKAIDLDKNYGDAYYNRGDAKYYLDDSIGACNDYQKALDAGVFAARKRMMYCQ